MRVLGSCNMSTSTEGAEFQILDASMRDAIKAADDPSKALGSLYICEFYNYGEGKMDN